MNRVLRDGAGNPIKRIPDRPRVGEVFYNNGFRFIVAEKPKRGCNLWMCFCPDGEAKIGFEAQEIIKGRVR